MARQAASLLTLLALIPGAWMQAPKSAPAAVPTLTAPAPSAATPSPATSPSLAPAPSTGLTDVQILNFALNLECLEAEFYNYAAYGSGLTPELRGGGPTPIGGQKANLTDDALNVVTEIARNEAQHVGFLRTALGSSAVACPLVNIGSAFSQAANAAVMSTTFNPAYSPYINDVDFWLASYLLEDVGVSAYKGAAPLISNKQYLSAAAGILAVEAYHAGIARLIIFMEGEQPVVVNPNPPTNTNVFGVATVIDSLREMLGPVQGPATDSASTGVVFPNGTANIIPVDANSIAYGRTVEEVLGIVYGSGVTNLKPGLFFPNGINM